MGLRETINERKSLATVVAVVLVVGAIVLVLWNQQSPITRLSKAYYCDENGQGLFTDSIDRVYPFEHNGKLAYRANVYQGADNKPFVAYLTRYNDDARARLESLLKKESDPKTAGEIAEARGQGMEVKKPGDKSWVPLFSQQGQMIATRPSLPNGSAAVQIDP